MDSAREHKFAFNEAISFIVHCETQGGQCGWLKDRYSLS